LCIDGVLVMNVGSDDIESFQSSFEVVVALSWWARGMTQRKPSLQRRRGSSMNAVASSLQSLDDQQKATIKDLDDVEAVEEYWWWW
jgi:hypothetical protein